MNDKYGVNHIGSPSVGLLMIKAREQSNRPFGLERDVVELSKPE